MVRVCMVLTEEELAELQAQGWTVVGEGYETEAECEAACADTGTGSGTIDDGTQLCVKLVLVFHDEPLFVPEWYVFTSDVSVDSLDDWDVDIEIHGNDVHAWVTLDGMRVAGPLIVLDRAHSLREFGSRVHRKQMDPSESCDYTFL